MVFLISLINIFNICCRIKLGCLSLLSGVRQYLGAPCELMALARIGMETWSLCFLIAGEKPGKMIDRGCSNRSNLSRDDQEMFKPFKGCSLFLRLCK